MKRIFYLMYGLIALVLLSSSSLYAGTGKFFNIIPSGTPAEVDVILCLNGKGPLTCQNYHVSALTLGISTVGSKAYPIAGIKSLTPGYEPTGCTYYSPTGYCLFSTSSRTSATIQLSKGSSGTPVVGLSTLSVSDVPAGVNSPVITITNSGNGAANALSILPSAGLTIVNNQCGASLPAQTSCQFTIHTTVEGSGTVAVSANNVPAQVINVTAGPAPAGTTISLPLNRSLAIPFNNPAGLSFTVTNNSENPAYDVTVDLSSTGWSGVKSSICTVIEGNGTCVLNVVSNIATPYLAQGNIPVVGANIQNAPPTINLAFSLQGYPVLEVTNATTVQVINPAAIGGAQWDSICGATQCNLYVTTHAASPSDGAYSDLLGNTYKIISTIHTQANTGGNAAANCYNISSDNTGTVAPGTWYLPAICQMGQSNVCTSNNTIDRLFQLNYLSIGGPFWSSTETTQGSAFSQTFRSGNQSSQLDSIKVVNQRTICVRALTY